MPSLTTTILTTAVTLTSFVTVTVGQYPPDYPMDSSTMDYPMDSSTMGYPVASSSSMEGYPVTTTTEYCPTCTAGEYTAADVIGPIEGLPQCVQTIVFECLQNSKCSPHDFACVCDELYKLNLEGRVNSVCPVDIDKYKKFQYDICNPHPAKSSTPAPPMPYSTGASNYTTTVPGPFSNTTIVVPVTTKVTKQKTVTIQVATTDAAGKPTTVPATIVTPVATPAAPGAPGAPGAAGTPAGPPGTAFTGAAAAVGVPEFGSVKSVMVAGAMGLMGLIFAEL